MTEAQAQALRFATREIARRNHRRELAAATRALRQTKRAHLALLLQAAQERLQDRVPSSHALRVCVPNAPWSPDAREPGRHCYVRIRETQSQREVTAEALLQSGRAVDRSDVSRARGRRAAQGLDADTTLAWWDCVVERLRGLCVTTNPSVEVSPQPGRRTVVDGGPVVSARTAAYMDAGAALALVQERVPAPAAARAELEEDALREAASARAEHGVHTPVGRVTMVSRYRTVTPARLGAATAVELRPLARALAADGTRPGEGGEGTDRAEATAKQLLTTLRKRTGRRVLAFAAR